MKNQKLIVMGIVAFALLGGLVLAHGPINDSFDSHDDYDNHMRDGVNHMMHGHMEGHMGDRDSMPCGRSEPLDEDGDGNCDHCGMPIESCPMHN